MINSVNLSGFPCFGNDAVLGDLTTVNYVFGPNGSGKTTISQSLASMADGTPHIDWASESQTVKVYNRDYIRTTFTKADGEERGVFLLGENSQDTFEMIEDLEEKHDKSVGKIARLQTNIDDAKNDLEIQRSELAAKVWERRSVIPEVIRREMTGLNGSLKQCLEITLSKAAEFPDRGEDTFDSLLPKAEVVFAKDVDEQPLVPPAPALLWNESTLREALFTPIIGSADVPLAEMIERLGISDWVREGVEHFHNQQDSPAWCPFCQQITPEDLGDQLANIFDDTYQEKRGKIEEFQQAVDSVTQSLASYKEKNLKTLQRRVEPVEVDHAFDALELSLQSVATSIGRKKMKPSDAVDVVTTAESYASLKSIVEKANQVIEKTNGMVRDRKKQRPIIIDDCWREFVRGYLDDLVTTFLTEKENATKKIQGLQGAIEQQKTFRQECETELRKLRARTTSSEATIQTINDMLAISQFHSFKLGKAQLTDEGYRIIRDDGHTADITTLSEGERTFITFLYFYHSLSEVKQDGETEKICAVIDDPISSLDGDIMFVVSALVRELIRSVRQGAHDRVSQVILLTHSTRFHEEVSYGHREEASGEVKFYRIRKFSPEPNQIEDCGQKNPIRSTYQELWDEVATAHARPDRRMPWLPNILRRILESYFSTLGGQGNLYKIGEGLPPAEKALHDALIAWAHRGSHTIVDAEVYAQSSTSNDRWLEAFERVFRKASKGAHLGHYEMMMGEARKYVH